MSVSLERILLVTSDPVISNFIIRQSLMPLGYQVYHVERSSEAIRVAKQKNPDLIIADLNLPDLSGKDLLVALSSQGIETPLVILAKEGMESDIIQAFRLGASDYLCWPARETEVLSAIERVLKQVRARREKERLTEELDKTNRKLQDRVRELKTILAIGKTVTSTKRQNELFEKVVEGAVYVTEADAGWLLIKEVEGDGFVLKAQKNLPNSYKTKLHQAWDDGLSSLVALSKDSLGIYGEPLKRFKVAQLGQSALVVPLKVRDEVAGLLVVVRKAARPFTKSNQALLEAVADYASISLVNVKLFQMIEERAHSLEKTAESARVSEREKEALLHTMNKEVRGGMMVAVGYIGMLVDGQMGKLEEEQLDALQLSQKRLKDIVAILENYAPEEANNENIEEE